MRFQFDITKKAKKITQSMTDNELLEQVICPQYFASDKTPANIKPGAFFVHSATKQELKEKIALLSSKCDITPLVATDMENGPGEMIKDGTKFPSMLAAGMCNNEEYAYLMGKAAATEGAQVGFNWSFSPCVDIFSNPNSPMVSIRSPGFKAKDVIQTAGAYMLGLQENHMMATLKHFPGDGQDIYDQHLGVPCNSLSAAQWLKDPGTVYKELINQGAMSIMMGHISLPAFDKPESQTGLYPPASLSKPIITRLLKERLQFEGLIISDAVNMGGFAGVYNPFDACVHFLNAGGDMLLFPPMDNFFTEMKNRINSEFLTRETLKNRVERILSVKETFLKNTTPETKTINTDYLSIPEKIVLGSIRIVRDRNNLVPFKINKKTKILHLIISSEHENEKNLFTQLTTELEAISEHVKTLVPNYPEQIFNAVYNDKIDLIITSVYSKPDYGTNTIGLRGFQARLMMCGWMRLGTPAIFISHGHPSFAHEYEYCADTVINTYGSIPCTMKPLIDAITGKYSFAKTN